MPKVILRHNPELTKDKIFDLFSIHFSEKYEVYKSNLIGSDLVIRKTGWTGVSVRLIQKKDKTMLVYSAFAPSAAVRLFLMGLIPMLICYATVWKDIQKEVKEFIESSSDLI